MNRPDCETCIHAEVCKYKEAMNEMLKEYTHIENILEAFIFKNVFDGDFTLSCNKYKSVLKYIL
jgi:hypothetical protein